jgi:uncharacterized circularly permuted ATP-grasp superfamily protein
MKTTAGLKQVDVIYRRVDDDYLDPLVFNPTSMLGVPGLYYAFRSGNVAIINAPGNGVADDKAVYPYVPEMIKYYLNEEPILKTVPTYSLDNPEHFALVFSQIQKMVIKQTNGSGGYGMLMGNAVTEKEIAEYKKEAFVMFEDLISTVESTIAARIFRVQPMMQRSTMPEKINLQAPSEATPNLGQAVQVEQRQENSSSSKSAGRPGQSADLAAAFFAGAGPAFSIIAITSEYVIVDISVSFGIL